MDRLQVIQTLMKQKKLRHYLEIGVFNGHIFFRIKSRFKIAVDPDFQFDWLRRLGKAILNPFNLFNRYYEKTSDRFFQEDAPTLLQEKKIEISLIDGMHEYDYVLRDIENTLRYSAPEAVLVVHDCNPETREAQVSFAEWKSGPGIGTWNGDVWKAILHLRSLRDDVEVFVLDCDHGLGIITRKENRERLPYTREQIRGFTYADLAANREKWLNLKPAGYFNEYFGIR